MTERFRRIGEITVVTATSDFHPLREVRSLSSKLAGLGIEGTVLFDLIFFNGLSSNRFVTMMFENNDFVRDSFSAAPVVSSEVRAMQDLMVSEDPDFLPGSVLSSDEVTRFAKSAPEGDSDC